MTPVELETARKSALLANLPPPLQEKMLEDLIGLN